MSGFYSFYRTLGWPVLKGLLRVAARFQNEEGKLRRGLEMRLPDASGVAPWIKGPGLEGCVWIHCASGEFEYAKPVITEIKRRDPSIPILVTYFSPTYAANVARFQGVDLALPLPWDTPTDVAEFLDHHEPRCLLIARTDAWPEMVRISRERQIPSLLFAATISRSSNRANGFGRWSTRAVLSQLNSIYAVTEDDVQNFTSLDLGRAEIERRGDTRFDQVIARLRSPKPLREELFSGIAREDLLVAGSSWPEDENVLADAIAMSERSKRWCLAPHEPTESHLSELEEKLGGRGFKAIRYSSAREWRTGEVLLLDQVGILAELYTKAGFAFVGGSFRKTVHSVMEPLAAGCLTAVGPLHHNNREAEDFNTILVGPSLLAVTEVKTPSDLKHWFARSRDLFVSATPLIKRDVEARTGATLAVVDWTLAQNKKASKV